MIIIKTFPWTIYRNVTGIEIQESKYVRRINRTDIPAALIDYEAFLELLRENAKLKEREEKETSLL